MYVGIDIGGTFTDVVAYDPWSGRTALAKVPSTPPGLVDGFMAGLREACARLGQAPTAVTRLAHGTTIATNAILEHRGARLGVLTTEGFRDVIVLGRMKRSRMYDLFMDAEVPLFLAPRRRIREVRERVDAEGEVVVPLDEAGLLAAARALVEGEGVEALVVCYLHSYANPVHEEQTRSLLAEAWPSVPVSLSAAVDPRFREYERLLVTAFDAYVRPAIAGYTGVLVERLRAEGVAAPLQLMHSRGGLSGAATTLERPIGTALSGPAAGVIGAAYAARSAGYPDAISIDVGGTSADVALIPGGEPAMTVEAHLDRYPLRMPTVDVQTVGAGGGSLAWVDEGGVLKVGPRSAGAVPGPACYGRGGEEPSVTDASVVLGYLDPERFAGGIRLRRDLAERAIRERVAGPLGFTPEAAALGVHRIVNSRMAQALRLVSVARGYDPRHFTLVALGGAGPLHAGRLAEELGIPRVLVPPSPGVLSALGLLLARVEHEFARTHRVRAEEADAADFAAILAALDRACAERMERDGVPAAGRSAHHYAEMRYVGQSYELEVELPALLDSEAALAAAGSFHAVHERAYGYKNEQAPVEFVTLRSVHRSLPLAEIPLGAAPAGGQPAPRRRLAWFGEEGAAECLVFDRESLPAGFKLMGPAIIEQPDTTTLVCPGQRLMVDASGNLVIEVGG